MALTVLLAGLPQQQARADAADDLVKKLRANAALAHGPFAVVFRLTAKLGEAAAIQQTMQRILPLTRAEPGCLSFALHRDADDPRTFFLYERWRGVDDLAAHLHTPYVQEAFRVYAASATDNGHASFGVMLEP